VGKLVSLILKRLFAMPRFLFILLFLVAGLSHLAPAQTDGLPARPSPFQFVNDQGQLLSAADAKKLESGLRRYADETGTQVVVVTVPTLGGREVADYGRALGTAWGVGQRDKNNGVVVLVAAKEHKVTIQAGSGIRDKITPELTQRVINQDFGPNFKQGNYLLGLRKGLSALMLAANPSSDPRKNAAGAATAGTSGAVSSSGSALNTEAAGSSMTTAPEPISQPVPVAPTEPAGPGMGTLLLGALAIGAVLWFVVKMFRSKAAANSANTAAGNAPNFNPNQPNRPGGGAPNFNPNQPQGGNYGPGYNNTPNFMGGGGLMGGGGPGIGGMLATGAAAAAGAYIGNRMAGGGHDTSANEYSQEHSAGLGGAGLGGGAGAGVSGDNYFENRDGATSNTEPDYFSDDSAAADTNGDYFSNDSGSYDDTSSADTGGGGFDGGDDNSGSW
jgi:uncharacterized protein